jgi:hypothetical protein
MWDMQQPWLKYVRITLEKHREADATYHSEQMGSNIDIQRLQSWGTCLLRPLFCSMANHDGKAAQIRHPVSLQFSCSWSLSALGTDHALPFETIHPLGKIARCRYPSNLMHTPLGRIPFPRHHDVTTKFARIQGSFSYGFIL